MGDTFYAALEVDTDADAAAIDRAYRERVKSHHPDVSDSPDAGERFQRLTTARDVLVDEDERARYDRLGHDEYVRRHAEGSAWAGAHRASTGTSSSSSGASGSATGSSEHPVGRAAAAASATDGGTDTPEPAGVAHGTATAGSGAAAGGTGTAYHRPGERMRPDAAETSMPSALEVLRSVGPWAILDLVLLTSGLATAWLVMRAGSLSLVSMAVATFLLVVVLCSTVFHLSVKAAG